MDKHSFVREISEQSLVPQRIGRAVYETLLDVIAKGLVRDRSVDIGGLGTFSLRRRKGRVCYNPGPRKVVSIKDRSVVKFSPCPAVYDRVLRSLDGAQVPYTSSSASAGSIPVPPS